MSILKKSCAASAAALIAAAGVVPMAMADPTNATLYPPTMTVENGGLTTSKPNIILAKTIKASQATPTAGDVYTFTFESTTDADSASGTVGGTDWVVAGDGTVDAGAYEGPAIADLTLTAQAMQDGDQVLERAVALPELQAGADVSTGKIGHAGMYEYIVKEKYVGAGSDLFPDVGNDTELSDWAVSKAQYVMRLYVINDDTATATGGLKYSGVTIERVVTDSGTKEETDTEQVAAVGNKIDPTDKNTTITIPTNTTTVLTEEQEANASNFNFTNSYSRVQDLSIKKQIKGEYADKTHQFPMSLTLTLPEGGTTQFAVEVHRGGSATASSATGDTGLQITAGTAFTFALADNDYIVVKNLPVGTAYDVQETSLAEGVNNYKAAATYTYNGKADVITGDFATKQNTVSDPSTPTIDSASGTRLNVASGAANVRTQVGYNGADVVYTNSLDNPPSPTGLALQYGPYVLLTLAAAGGLTYLVIGRRRRESQAD